MWGSTGPAKERLNLRRRTAGAATTRWDAALQRWAEASLPGCSLWTEAVTVLPGAPEDFQRYAWELVRRPLPPRDAAPPLASAPRGEDAEKTARRWAQMILEDVAQRLPRLVEGGTAAAVLQGDSRTVVRWINGLSRPLQEGPPQGRRHPGWPPRHVVRRPALLRVRGPGLGEARFPRGEPRRGRAHLEGEAEAEDGLFGGSMKELLPRCASASTGA